MYRVIRRFKDLQDNGRVYNVGDKFPYGETSVDNSRIMELSTDKNRRGVPLIEAVSEASPVTEKTPEESNPAEMSTYEPKSKKRARKGIEKNA